MDIDILAAMSQGPVELAVKMWQERFNLPVGVVSMVKREFTIEVHHLSETEFLLVIEDVPLRDKLKILDVIHGRA